MVGAVGFEPTTSWSQTTRASQTALRPVPPPFIDVLGLFCKIHARGALPSTAANDECPSPNDQSNGNSQ